MKKCQIIAILIMLILSPYLLGSSLSVQGLVHGDADRYEFRAEIINATMISDVESAPTHYFPGEIRINMRLIEVKLVETGNHQNATKLFSTTTSS